MCCGREWEELLLRSEWSCCILGTAAPSRMRVRGKRTDAGPLRWSWPCAAGPGRNQREAGRVQGEITSALFETGSHRVTLGLAHIWLNRPLLQTARL